MKITARYSLVFLLGFCTSSLLAGAELTNYFVSETQRLADNALAEIKSADDWHAAKPKYRQQLFEMLSLDPLPAKSDLKPVITGRVERDGVIVEKLHFQSMP